MTTVATAAVVCRTWLSLRLPTPNIFRFDFGCDWRIRILFLFVSTDRNYLVILSSFFCLFCSLNRLITACHRGPLWFSELLQLHGEGWAQGSWLEEAQPSMLQVVGGGSSLRLMVSWLSWQAAPRRRSTEDRRCSEWGKGRWVKIGRQGKERGWKEAKYVLVRFRTNLLPTTDSSAVQGARQVVNLLLSR